MTAAGILGLRTMELSVVPSSVTKLPNDLPLSRERRFQVAEIAAIILRRSSAAAACWAASYVI